LVRIEIALLEGDTACLLRLLEEDNLSFLMLSAAGAESVGKVRSEKKELAPATPQAELPFHYRLFLESAPAPQCLKADELLSQKVKCLNLVYRALRTPPPRRGASGAVLWSGATATSSRESAAAYAGMNTDASLAIQEYLAVYANTWTAPRLQMSNAEVLGFLFDSCARAIALLSENGGSDSVDLVRERLTWFVRMLCFKVDTAACWKTLRERAPLFWQAGDEKLVDNALLVWFG
jgi:hypothetical protein